ncbi:M1 family aminopeptidase [Geodermatophilus sp. SYSU D00691]
MRRARGGAALAALLVLTGCTSFVDGMSAPAAAPSGGAPEDEGFSCPAERAEPDPDRPVVDLEFRLSDDGTTVTGTETVTFTPDLDTDRLVFRLVANAPPSARSGNQLTVDEVRGDDVEAGRYVAAGAADPGGLYEVALDGELAAGDPTEVELDFTLRLGGGEFDRFGTDDGLSWWASGFPLLAWEPGVGWAEDPFVQLQGETASSPVADTTISVSAPEALTVLMTGDMAEPSAPEDGRRTWTSTEPVARDVSVAAGDFTTEERTTEGGTRVTVGVLPGGDLELGQLADWTVQAITDLEGRFGPFPYETLTVPLLPSYGGGIEYPSSILMAAPSRNVLVHEVGHMWFYGMVGDSQFRDPWLDEAFATFTESVNYAANGSAVDRALQRPGEVGGSMDEFPDDDAYFSTVYGKGGAALLAAREAAGAEAFDAAMRCYVDANAWTIATPADVAAAFAQVPPALAVLLQAGAVSKESLDR